MKKAKITGVFLLTILTVSLLFAVPHSYSGVPQLINYQGKLTDKNGSAVPNGSYDATFSIYDVASGGTALWSETWTTSTSQIKTVGGVFNAMLGTYLTIPATFFSQNQTTYLGIKVGTDSEMIPRQKITSVGYAFSAGNAETANSASNGVPQGAIMMWSGAINQIPAGWALCNGTNGTPDLRDRFIVGAGNSYNPGVTGGEAAHVLAISEMPSHTHIQNAHTHTQNAHNHGISSGSGTQGSGWVANTNNGTPGIVTDNATAVNQNTTATNQNTGGGAAHNNLPPYYALAFIMKL